MSDFLKQLQESTGLLNNRIKDTDTTQVKGLFGNYNPRSASDYVNGVPQNRFVGNQFQLPYQPGEFTTFGGQFGSGGFGYNPGTYNPGQFNQYGNVPVTGNIPSNVSTTTMQGGGEGDVGGIFGGVQGQNDPDNPRNQQDSYSLNDDGTITQFDASTGLKTTYNLDDEDLTIAQKLFGSLTNVPTTASVIENILGGLLGGGQPQVDPTDPTTYGYTGPVANTGLAGLLSNIGKEGLKGKGTQDTTEAAAAAAAATQQAIAQATQQAALTQGPQQQGPGAGGTVDKGGKSKGSGGFGGLGDGAGGACFEPNTYIKMQDGSEKKIKDVQLGDLTKGGKVTGVLQFEPIDDIHEYNGVIVAGSHFVKEGNEFIMVQDSPESIKIDKIPVVYSLDTSNRRIFINDIEFADYNGDGIAKNFLNNAGMDLSGFDKEVLRQVEHRLI